MSNSRAPSWRMRIMAQFLVVLMALTSCVTTSQQQEDDTLLSDQERALRAESDRWQTSILVGCGSGAAIALIISKAKGYSTSSTITNVLIGAAAGCAAGAAAGYYLNSRNKDYANEQQASRELIKAADADVKRYSELNQTTDSLIKQQRAKIANLNARYQSKEITAAAYRKQIASAENNTEILNGKIEEANDNIKLMKSDIDRLKEANVNTTALEKKRQQLIEERNRLEQKVELLAATYDAVPKEVRAATS